MRKYLLLVITLIFTLNCAYSAPISASISRDYDFGFESIVKNKFKTLFHFVNIFEKDEDIFYHKGYRPLYMLSVKDVYTYESQITSNIEKRQVPNTYTLSFSNIEEKKVLTEEEIFEKKRDEFKFLISQNPSRIEPLFKYAQFLYSNKKHKEAVAVLNEILVKKPSFVLASFTLGNIYFDLGEYKKAIKANLNVIKTNPYCADAYFNIASALEKLQKFRLAMDYYQKCLSLNANDTQAQKALQRLEQVSYND